MSISEKTVKKYLDEARDWNNKRLELEEESRTMPMWDTGSIKWFDPVRRFGFVISDQDGSQLFLPWTIVQESRIAEKSLRIGLRVRYRWRPPRTQGKNCEVTHLVIIR